MTRTAAGGGTGAAQWAAHAQCMRFRDTDSFVTGRPRRALAGELGAKDTSAHIPRARWTRAMIFERLCHRPEFAGEVTARAAGWAGFRRPTSVVTADCRMSTVATRDALTAALARAATSGSATLLSRLAVPFPGANPDRVTAILPDLAVVALGPTGPTLIVGDVKDYERVRSRLDDGRLLKGFLQVAMGAVAFQEWTDLPTDLTVSTHGFLAVPRNAFLQPTVEVEDLADHVEEVRAQVNHRAGAAAAPQVAATPEYVRHLVATFDPASCPSCSLHNFCRSELRESTDRLDLLTEIGIPDSERESVEPVLQGQPARPDAKARTAAQVTATVTGRAVRTGQHRLDMAGVPGSIDVVSVKSDSAALGFHGLGVRRHAEAGPGEWRFKTFDDPQSDTTRRAVMGLIGWEIGAALKEAREARRPERPVHIVVPDRATADLLATTADQLAGVELSRLRWVRDRQMDRPALTYNGEPANIPRPLNGERRTAVSFLLEQDRARMLKLRSPIVTLTDVVAEHFVAGGPAVSARRLDYAVAWADADGQVDFREIGDAIEASPHTPGARMSNDTSDAVSAALEAGESQLAEYERLAEDELRYKAGVVDAALLALEQVPDSRLLPAVRSFEGDAQQVWQRRMRLQASDLVRFGRTYDFWRNRLVDVIDSDRRAFTQIRLLANPQVALNAAVDAGDRSITCATVVSVSPLTLEVASRRFTDGAPVTLVAVNGEPWVEGPGASVALMKGAVQLKGFPQAALGSAEGTTIVPGPRRFLWAPRVDPGLQVGDEVILVRLDAFDAARRRRPAAGSGRRLDRAGHGQAQGLGLRSEVHTQADRGPRSHLPGRARTLPHVVRVVGA